MTWFEGTATGLKDLHATIRNKVCGYKENDPAIFSGVGGGSLTYFGAKPGSANQTWLITCTDATTEGAEVWSVSGSAADATSNVYYNEAEVSFMIVSDNVTPFQTGAQFSVVVTGDGQATIDGNAWILDQEEMTPGISGSTMQMHGIGLSLDRHIGIISNLNHTAIPERAAIGFKACSGYSDLIPIAEQPGIDNDTKHILLWDNDMEYRIVVNNQRFIVLAEVSTTGHGLYAGFFFPYGPPSTYGFPIYIGSDCDTNTYEFGSSSRYVGSFVNPGVEGGRIQVPGGAYENVQHYSNDSSRTTGSNSIWPVGADYSYITYAQLREAEDDTYSLFPCVLQQQTPGEMLGELDGVCAIPGNNLAIKDTITADGDTWIIWNDSSRTSTVDYYAVRLL